MMKKKYIPVKLRGNGLHIWCSTCKKVVTNNPCAHSAKWSYQSRIYNPISKRQDCIKTHMTNDVNDAFERHMAYKKELKRNNFNIPDQSSISQAEIVPMFLLEGAKMYFDYLEDINVPEHEKKNRTKQYINDQVRYVKRFLTSLKSIHGKLSNYPLQAIDQSHVGAFHNYVESQQMSSRSYNAHMEALRFMFDYLINHRKVDISNPFSNVTRKKTHYSPEIITEEEFVIFLSKIDQENGVGSKGVKVISKVNYYRPWLSIAFKLAISIGERLDGLVNLKWKDVKENYIGIPNWKVNRTLNTDVYYSYTPITKDLAELLTQLEMKKENDYLIVPDWSNRNTLKKFITKAFTHFWRKTEIDKQVSFRHLRKTYITRMVDLIGEKAKHIKHTNDKTVIKHYLAEKELLEDLRNVKLYDFD